MDWKGALKVNFSWQQIGVKFFQKYFLENDDVLFYLRLSQTSPKMNQEYVRVQVQSANIFCVIPTTPPATFKALIHYSIRRLTPIPQKEILIL